MLCSFWLRRLWKWLMRRDCRMRKTFETLSCLSLKLKEPKQLFGNYYQFRFSRMKIDWRQSWNQSNQSYWSQWSQTIFKQVLTWVCKKKILNLLSKTWYTSFSIPCSTRQCFIGLYTTNCQLNSSSRLLKRQPHILKVQFSSRIARLPSMQLAKVDLIMD